MARLNFKEQLEYQRLRQEICIEDPKEWTAIVMGKIAKRLLLDGFIINDNEYYKIKSVSQGMGVYQLSLIPKYKKKPLMEIDKVDETQNTYEPCLDSDRQMYMSQDGIGAYTYGIAPCNHCGRDLSEHDWELCLPGSDW
jgi:hypothetical protein